MRRLAVLLLLVLALVLGGFTLSGDKVTVAIATEGPLRQSVVASGRVRTPERILLAAQISGRVEAVEVREGDVVERGQVLLRIDERELRASVNQAAAAVEQAEARLRQLRELALPVAEQALLQAEANALQAERQHQRVAELVARGFYSEAQLDEARRAQEVAAAQLRSARLQRDSQRGGGIEVELARTALAQARAAHALAQTRLSHASLQADAAATVLTRSVEAGDTVQPGVTLMTMAPVAATELTVQIDEKNLGLLALGQPARASADAYPAASFDAVVSYIAPSVDALRASVEVRLQVSQPPPYLRHEMTVSIDIETAQRERALLVPAAAVQGSGSGSARPWLQVVRAGRSVHQPVVLGVRGDGMVEVLDGLSAGEAVVLMPRALADGRKVRMRVQQ